MNRIFINEVLASEQNSLAVKGQNMHYLSKVMRMQAGDKLIVSDLNQLDFVCSILSFEKDQIILAVDGRQDNKAESLWYCHIYQSLTKGDKFEHIIQKSVELGCHAITPVNTTRVISRLKPERVKSKLERWNKIALAAARQCGRSFIPTVHSPLNFAQAVSALSEFELSFLLWEKEHNYYLRTVLAEKMPQITEAATSFGFLIGPEGGFTDAEADMAKAKGLHRISLGRRILRTETVAPALLAMLNYQYDQLEH